MRFFLIVILIIALVYCDSETVLINYISTQRGSCLSAVSVDTTLRTNAGNYANAVCRNTAKPTGNFIYFTVPTNYPTVIISKILNLGQYLI